jgi:catalase
MTLNRMPGNYFAEVEQSAFSPANLVLGMGYSPDKMLQARIFSYADAHRHRMGVNYDSLPVNQPKCPVHTYHRDGYMRFDANGGSEPNYQPNSFAGPAEDPHFRDFSWAVNSSIIDRYDHRQGNDDFIQAGELFRLLAPDAQQRLIHNIVMSMKGVPRDIQARQIRHFLEADVRYGRGIMDGLCCEPKTVQEIEEPEEVSK